MLEQRPALRALAIIGSALVGVECLAATAGGNRTPSLCKADEQVIFSCVTVPQRKTASLCASKVLRADHGYIVYRFGRLGSVEFEYPQRHEGSRTKFFYSHYFRALVDRSEVRFDNVGFRYELFDYYEEQNGTPSYLREVTVSRTNGQGGGVTLACESKIFSRLEALANVLPCDEESDLGVGCPGAK